MKIFIINTVQTGKNGITNVIFNYLSSMDRDGMTIDFLSLNQPDKLYVDIVEQGGGKVYVLPNRNRIIAYWNGLRQLIKREQYNIIHIHGNSHTTLLELSAAKMAGCDVRIVHAHSTSCKHIVSHRILSSLFNALCTHGLACGKEAGSFMFGTTPFEVMNNGVDTTRFAYNEKQRTNVRKSLKMEDNLILGHVGYFKPLKNQSFIVDILECLYKKNPLYRLILIGDGPLKDEVYQKIVKKGLADVVYMPGNIDNVDNYLNAIDLIVMPSLFEGLPLSLMEQQASGLQCVVSDTITREVDKTGNLLFLPLSLSANEWAENIVSYKDEITREERSRRAVESIRVAGYSIKEEARKLRSYYQNTLKKEA